MREYVRTLLGSKREDPIRKSIRVNPVRDGSVVVPKTFLPQENNYKLKEFPIEIKENSLVQEFPLCCYVCPQSCPGK